MPDLFSLQIDAFVAQALICFSLSDVLYIQFISPKFEVLIHGAGINELCN